MNKQFKLIKIISSAKFDLFITNLGYFIYFIFPINNTIYPLYGSCNLDKTHKLG
jgi:hypothetical protein